MNCKLWTLIISLALQLPHPKSAGAPVAEDCVLNGMKSNRPCPLVAEKAPVPVEGSVTPPVRVLNANQIINAPPPVGYPPVCAGGLLSQHASAKVINDYIAKYTITSTSKCRYMPPPRCFIGEIAPRWECTP